MKAQQLTELKNEIIKFIAGTPQAVASAVHTPESASINSLVFVSTPQQMELALDKKAAIVISGIEPAAFVPRLGSSQCLFHTSKVNLAMSLVLPFFDKKRDRFAWSGQDIHSTAYVDPSAQIGAKVKIGPHAFVGAHTKIGEGTLIGAQAVIENECRIGPNCIIHPLSFIGANTEMGHSCEIHPQVTIGGDGFGFATDKSGQQNKIPQLGRVVLGDMVEIGANSTIDRATLTETRIQSGTKLDKHVHIAHNCDIGENSLIAGGFFVAGSSKIGKNFMVGGTAVVTDHVNITDNVVLAGRGVVTNDIEKPGAYGGYPLQPLRDSLKTIANLQHLSEMRRQLSLVLKKLGLAEDK